MEVFDAQMPGPNQLNRIDKESTITEARRPLHAAQVPEGVITRQGLVTNVAVGLRYLESWLRGQGCVPIFNLMEDAATAEISRAQIWQWMRHPAGRFEDATKITAPLVESMLDEELGRLRESLGPQAYAASRFDDAGRLFLEVSTADEFVEFLTLPAYEQLE